MLNKSIRKTKSNNPTASETSTICLNELHCCQIIQINVFCFGVFKDLLIIIQVNCQWSIAEFPQFPTYFQHLKPIMIFATNVISQSAQQTSYSNHLLFTRNHVSFDSTTTSSKTWWMKRSQFTNRNFSMNADELSEYKTQKLFQTRDAFSRSCQIHNYQYVKQR